MQIATVSTIISLIFLIAFVAAMIILQVYLSRRESKLPGLVLPAITFSGELFILLNVVTNVVMTSVADNAVGGVDSYSVFVTVLNTVLTLLVISMPTIVLLVIYFLCRRRMNRKKADREDEYSGFVSFSLTLSEGIRRLRTARICRAPRRGVR